MKLLAVDEPSTLDNVESHCPLDQEDKIGDISRRASFSGSSVEEDEDIDNPHDMNFCDSFFSEENTFGNSKPDPSPSSDLEIPSLLTPTKLNGKKVKQGPIKKERKSRKKRIVNANYKFRPYQEEKWKERFEDLLAFRSKNKNCLVPHTYPTNPTLARWVKRQRYQYKLFQQGEQSSMTQERIDMLDDVGFVWHSHEVVWQERLSELLDFKKRHGDCLVPSNYAPNPKLATWVKCQRRQYKLHLRGSPSNITVDRIKILENIGFEWELRSSSYSIKTQIAEHQKKVVALKNELIPSPIESIGTIGLPLCTQEGTDDYKGMLDFLTDDDTKNEEPLEFLMNVLDDLPEDDDPAFADL